MVIHSDNYKKEVCGMRLKILPLVKEAVSTDEIIKSELRQTQEEIDRIYDLFQNQTDEDLLESCIYQLQSLKARQSFLIKKAKESKLHSCREIFGAYGKKDNA